MVNRLWTIVLVALLSPVLSRVVVSPVERMAQDCVAATHALPTSETSGPLTPSLSPGRGEGE